MKSFFENVCGITGSSVVSFFLGGIYLLILWFV